MLDVTRPFLFVQPFLSLTATEKKQQQKKPERLLQNIILYKIVVCPGERRGGSVMKGNVAPGSSAEARVKAESYSSNY